MTDFCNVEQCERVRGHRGKHGIRAVQPNGWWTWTWFAASPATGDSRQSEGLDVDAFLKDLTERGELSQEWRDGIEYARLKLAARLHGRTPSRQSRLADAVRHFGGAALAAAAPSQEDETP